MGRWRLQGLASREPWGSVILLDPDVDDVRIAETIGHEVAHLCDPRLYTVAATGKEAFADDLGVRLIQRSHRSATCVP